MLANVVSQEQSVASIVAKLAAGDADAGFVYVTDTKAAAGRLSAIAIPASAKPTATYALGVVSASGAADEAGRFVQFVRSPAGQRILTAAGFGPAP